MIDKKLLKDAVDWANSELFTLNAYLNDKEMVVHEKRFIRAVNSIKEFKDLAEQFLKLEGFPEKKRLLNKMPYLGYNDEVTGFNECHDLCKLVVLKDYVKRETYLKFLKDSCEEEDYIRKAVKGLIPEFEIEGDSYGVPMISDIVDSLIKTMKKDYVKMSELPSKEELEEILSRLSSDSDNAQSILDRITGGK